MCEFISEVRVLIGDTILGVISTLMVFKERKIGKGGQGRKQDPGPGPKECQSLLFLASVYWIFYHFQLNESRLKKKKKRTPTLTHNSS